MKKTLVFLAAGIGSRYGGLKQMEPVGPSGEFIIDYSVYDAIRAGFDKVVFVIRRDIEDDFKTTIGKRLEGHIAIEYAFQDIPEGRTKPLGTAHAVLSAAEKTNEPFAIINADDFYGKNGFAVLSDFLEEHVSDSSYCMVGYKLKETISKHGSVARGICQLDQNNNLIDVAETIDIKATDIIDQPDPESKRQQFSGNEIISANLWGFTPSLFAHIEKDLEDFIKNNADNPKAELFIPVVISRLISEEKATVKVLQTDSTWLGVTYPQDKDGVVTKIKQLVESGEYPPALWD